MQGRELCHLESVTDYKDGCSEQEVKDRIDYGQPGPSFLPGEWVGVVSEWWAPVVSRSCQGDPRTSAQNLGHT
jgi:hypothetical protein